MYEVLQKKKCMKLRLPNKLDLMFLQSDPSEIALSFFTD